MKRDTDPKSVRDLRATFSMQSRQLAGAEMVVTAAERWPGVPKPISRKVRLSRLLQAAFEFLLAVAPEEAGGAHADPELRRAIGDGTRPIVWRAFRVAMRAVFLKRGERLPTLTDPGEQLEDEAIGLVETGICKDEDGTEDDRDQFMEQLNIARAAHTAAIEALHNAIDEGGSWLYYLHLRIEAARCALNNAWWCYQMQPRDQQTIVRLRYLGTLAHQIQRELELVELANIIGERVELHDLEQIPRLLGESLVDDLPEAGIYR